MTVFRKCKVFSKLSLLSSLPDSHFLFLCMKTSQLRSIVWLLQHRENRSKSRMNLTMPASTPLAQITRKFLAVGLALVPNQTRQMQSFTLWSTLRDQTLSLGKLLVFLKKKYNLHFGNLSTQWICFTGWLNFFLLFRESDPTEAAEISELYSTVKK